MVGGGEVKKQGWTEWEQMGLKRRGVKEEKRWSRQEECLCRYVHPAGPRLEVMEGGVWAEFDLALRSSVTYILTHTHSHTHTHTHSIVKPGQLKVGYRRGMAPVLPNDCMC